jgi:hypothetical protein
MIRKVNKQDAGAGIFFSTPTSQIAEIRTSPIVVGELLMLLYCPIIELNCLRMSDFLLHYLSFLLEIC